MLSDDDVKNLADNKFYVEARVGSANHRNGTDGIYPCRAVWNGASRNEAADLLIAVMARELLTLRAECERLNEMLRKTGYGQGQIDAFSAECERAEKAEAENERLRGSNPDAAIGAARAADALATGNLEGRCHKCGYRLPKKSPHNCPAAIAPPKE